MPRSLLVRIAAAAAVATITATVVAVALRRPRGERARPGAGGDWLRRFVTTRFNPAVERLGLVGGRRSRWAYIEHVGRHSGRVYRTPVLPRLRGDHAYVPLPYGEDVDWARNVRAAGQCRLQLRATTYELDEPKLIGAADHPDLPPILRRRLERSGRRYLELHVLATLPGPLEENPVEAPVAPSEVPVGAGPEAPAVPGPEAPAPA